MSVSQFLDPYGFDGPPGQCSTPWETSLNLLVVAGCEPVIPGVLELRITTFEASLVNKRATLSTIAITLVLFSVILGFCITCCNFYHIY